ncbi:hypothetical protein ACFPYI_15440 [Halomarina salina]|uniref:Uncharacterized protein n=1 Tax=Halomarina salina TaxID=1872699 RepID=A0ABD5RRI7_9EURY|nr:hypothetical protein [Halomarina salina]
MSSPPQSPSYRDDRYAGYGAGLVVFGLAVVAAVFSRTATGAYATLAGRFVGLIVLGSVGVFAVAAGSESSPVHRRVVSDTRGRRLLLKTGGLALWTPALTSLATVVSGGVATDLSSSVHVGAVGLGLLGLAVCWRALDAVLDRARDGRTGR